MKNICILILVCLLPVACSGPRSPSPLDNQATIEAGVMQALTAQANQIAIDQTLAAMATNPASQVVQPPAPVTSATPQTPENTPTPMPTLGNSNPQVHLTYVPPKGSSDDLQGRVEGVNPDNYGIAVYIKVGGGWWTKPYFNVPVTYIDSDGDWTCDITTGGVDPQATAIRVYLIPIEYIPPATSGDASLSPDLEQNAVAWVEATRE